jgi:hypothetical protein
VRAISEITKYTTFTPEVTTLSYFSFLLGPTSPTQYFQDMSGMFSPRPEVFMKTKNIFLADEETLLVRAISFWQQKPVTGTYLVFSYYILVKFNQHKRKKIVKCQKLIADHKRPRRKTTFI